MDHHHDHENSKSDQLASQLTAPLNVQPDAKAFVPPRHWIGPAELEESYWSDPATKEKRAQEFYEKPVEWLEKIEKSEKSGLARRDFLTLMGASMAMAGFGCARRPVHKIIPYVVKPEEITPGVPTWYASTCGECSTGCGVLVKNREGRPIKLEGNPDHPMNQGALCGRGQASLLNLYDPDRLKAPKAMSRSDASGKEVSWAHVDASIQAQLKKIAASGGRVHVLSGEIKSDSTRQLIQEFLAPFSAARSHVEFEPLALEEVSRGQEYAYGTDLVPHYRLDQADLIVSLGADFLGNWLSPIEHAQAWSKKRKLIAQNSSQARLSKLVCFEPMMTVTGANADERFAVRPGDELKVALAIAHELVVKQKRSAYANDPTVQATLKDYTIEKVAQEIGFENGSARLQSLAEELWSHRGKSLVIAGGIPSKTEEAVALQIAAHLLNSILENEGSTVDGVFAVSTLRSNFAQVARLFSDMKAGQVDALIVYRSNPAYTLPGSSLGVEQAFKRVPLVIVISDREDETAKWADYVLPDHHYLENWGDATSQKGLYSLQQPAMAPIHDTRSFQDSLLTWKKAMSSSVSSSGAATLTSTSPSAGGASDWHGYLKNYWKQVIYKEAGAAGTFEQFWEGVLRSGVYETAARRAYLTKKPTPRTFQKGSLAQIPKYTSNAQGQVSLALYSKVSMHDGRSANNAWLQELPDPISSVTWDNYLNVSPTLAKKLGFKDDDVVEVNLGDVSAHLPVHLQPGLHPAVATVAVGYGRRAAGKVGNFAGVDAFPLAKTIRNQLVFSGQSVTLQKTGKFYRLASTQWHTATEDRPIINDITLAEFRKNPAAANHTDPHLRLETVPSLWPAHEYKGYKWGMAIDLNSCTGCGACMIACQAENNIPVVGRDQVRVSRQMHWIRIDRYYKGSPENPDVVFQPMLCQHCDNAPCETVCPVLATMHDDEGLNVQVYNRCVGTRYCQNNCPYKVRRFNFFDHWKAYEGPMNMAWNPDVTVRTRGIMEKCTFCTQRIRDAKDKAKDAGERVRDGDFKTACQQTCPTDAIVFGDTNDPESRVTKMKESQQAFRVLEVLNTKPAVSYLSKVRNKAEGSHHSSAHHAGS